jgi:hypothetical protein
VKAHRGSTPRLVLSALLALVAGCTATPQAREAVLTFDGETCHYDGPQVTTEGEFTVVLNNQSDLEADLWVVRLDQGRTWQDMLDYIGTPGSNVHPPEWSSGSIVKTTSPDNPDATILRLTEGSYAICCCTCYEPFGPRGVWPGASLEVRAE